MIATRRSADLLFRDDCATGEGPVVLQDGNELAWVDIPAGDLIRGNVQSGDRTVESYPTFLGAAAPRRRGGWVAAVSNGFAFLDGKELDVVDVALPEPGRRMNDAKCDALGRMWAGSCGVSIDTGGGALHCWDGSSRSIVVRSNLTLPNGLGWSPDGTKMYLVDSIDQIVFRAAFDLADATLGELLPFYRVSEGLPDGLSVDADGCLWLAVWGAGEVHRVAPDGRLLERLPVPVSQPSSCAIGPDGTLFITSARGGLSDTELQLQLLAGSVFAASIGVPPVPITEFAA